MNWWGIKKNELRNETVYSISWIVIHVISFLAAGILCLYAWLR